MKTRNKYLYFFISIISLIYLLGCTHVMNAKDIPTLQMGSPLRGIEPKTFAFRDFRDIRGVEDTSFMLKIGANTHSLDQPPAIFIADRIKKEFERNGHRCVNASLQANADFIVDGNIYKMSLQNIVGMWTTTQIAYTGVKLTINRVPSNSGVFVKSYEGEYMKKSAIVSGLVLTLGEAVLSMIKDMSTDSELIKFIKK